MFVKTFLFPYPSFQQSIACYSDTLLFYTFKSLDTLTLFVDEELTYRDAVDLNNSRYDDDYGLVFWAMWRNYFPAFHIFSLQVLKECHKRGLVDNIFQAMKKLEATRPLKWIRPWWLGNPVYNETHRKFLLFLGECEVAARGLVSLREWQPVDLYSDRAKSILRDCFDNYSIVSDWGLYDLQEAQNRLHGYTHGPEIISDDNWYKQFDWTNCWDYRQYTNQMDTLLERLYDVARTGGVF